MSKDKLFAPAPEETRLLCVEYLGVDGFVHLTIQGRVSFQPKPLWLNL